MSIDLDAYCRRIGYAGDRTPTLDTLRDLHLLHPQAMAFENLDPLLKRPVPLDLPALQRKLVHGGRGGYCYEHNLLFAAALRAMGFKVTELAARVLWNRPEGAVTPRVHMLLLVDIAGEDYVADVGFGGNTMTGPLLLRSPAAQPTPHEPFRLIEAGGEFVAQAMIKGAWAPLYRFDLVEQLLPDHEQGNWYMATHPSSRFVDGLMAGRPDAGRRYALLNNHLAVHRAGRDSEKQVLRTAAELRDALTDLFKLTLPQDGQLDRVLAKMTEGTPR